MLMVGKWSRENLPLIELKHIEILGRSGLWKVHNNMTWTLKVDEGHWLVFKQLRLLARAFCQPWRKILLFPKSEFNLLIQGKKKLS